jgi:FkbM family methyltransferase
MAGRNWTFRPQPGVRISLPGSAFGGAREMYCRSVYAARAGYAPARGDTVVDLGAGEGLFSVLAAAAGASRVLAVEARPGFEPLLARHATANGVAGRINLVHARFGAGRGARASSPAGRPGGDGPLEGLAELLDRHGLRQVDLMKIDIEGAEFALFAEPSWLGRIGRIVMEVHPEHGDPAGLQRTLTEHGFASILLDNALVPTPTLTHARSGYLYARRRVTPPRPRGDASAQPAARGADPGSRP